MGEPEEMGQFAGKMILVFFQPSIAMDNAPDCLKHRFLLLLAEFSIDVIGKFKKIYRQAPFTVGQIKKILGMLLGQVEIRTQGVNDVVQFLIGTCVISMRCFQKNHAGSNPSPFFTARRCIWMFPATAC